MKAIIKSQSRFGIKYEEKEMNTKELADIRHEIVKNIERWFKWSDYGKAFMHLVYYVEEHSGLVYIYRNGFLMGEKEFNDRIADNPNVAFAGVIHRRD